MPGKRGTVITHGEAGELYHTMPNGRVILSEPGLSAVGRWTQKCLTHGWTRAGLKRAEALRNPEPWTWCPKCKAETLTADMLETA